MALTNKRRMFAEYYMQHFDQTRAAIQAGYSEKSAYSQGYDLLREPEISDYIRARMREVAMDTDEVLYHLAQIARGNVSDLIDVHGNIDVQAARDAEKTGLIKRVKVKTIVTEESDTFESEVEAYDRLKALELIGKYHAMWTDKVRVSDWRDEVIPLIRDGKIDFETLKDEIGISLAEELFNSVGVAITPTGTSEADG